MSSVYGIRSCCGLLTVILLAFEVFAAPKNIDSNPSLQVYPEGLKNPDSRCPSAKATYHLLMNMERLPGESGPESKLPYGDLENGNTPYYTVIRCKSGRIDAIYKRKNKKMEFYIEYIYRKDELIGTRVMFANGKESTYHALTTI